MPGENSDRRSAIGFALTVFLCAAAAMATFPPNEALPLTTEVDGMPRLLLYLLAAVSLAVTASSVALVRPGDGIAGDGSTHRQRYWCAAWMALALLVATVNGIRLDRDIAARGGATLWILSMVLLVVSVSPSPAVFRDVRVPRRRPPVWVILFATLLLIAVAARVVGLTRVPVNVQADEGDRAASALDVLDKVAPASWFESGWFYVNMVYFRVLAMFFDAFGVGVAQGRLLNAVAGLVLVGAVAWIGFRQFDRRIALTATALAAVSPLALQFSRTIAESGVGAALAALSLAAFLEGGRTGRVWAFAAAGLTGGLSVYTYASARSWPIAAAATIAILLARGTGTKRSLTRGASVTFAAAFVAVVPFAAHLRDHSDELSLRFRQTTVLSAENRPRLGYSEPNEMPLSEVLALQVERSLGLIDRYEDKSQFLPSGKPIFPRLLAVLTLLGVFYATVRSVRDTRLAILAVWFWVGLAGVILTVDTPAAQRAAGLVGTLPLLAAVVLWELASRVAPTMRYARARWGTFDLPPPDSHYRTTVDLTVVVLVASLMGVQSWSYFVDYGRLRSPWSDPTTEARQIAELGRDGPVYSLESSEHRVKSGWVRFLARDATTGSVAGPGTQLPVIQPDEPYADLTWRQRVPLPLPKETMSFVLYGSDQLPYVSLLRDLYGRGSTQPMRDNRFVFQARPGSASRRLGVAVRRNGRLIGVVAAFGGIPPATALPARLSWGTGFRVARPGLHRLQFTAPLGYQLLLDGTRVASGQGSRPVEAIVRVPSGLHFLRMQAVTRSRRDAVDLRWSGRLSSRRSVRPAQPFAPAQTYPAMTSVWGLLSRVVDTDAHPGGRPSQVWPALSTTVAAGFVSIPEPLPASGRIEWSGTLLIPTSGLYRMALLSDGATTIRLDGRSLTGLPLRQASEQGLPLRRGAHPIWIRIRSDGATPTYARWLWIPPLRDASANRRGSWTFVPPSVLRPEKPVQLVATTE